MVLPEPNGCVAVLIYIMLIPRHLKTQVFSNACFLPWFTCPFRSLKTSYLIAVLFNSQEDNFELEENCFLSNTLEQRIKMSYSSLSRVVRIKVHIGRSSSEQVSGDGAPDWSPDDGETVSPMHVKRMIKFILKIGISFSFFLYIYLFKIIPFNFLLD